MCYPEAEDRVSLLILSSSSRFISFQLCRGKTKTLLLILKYSGVEGRRLGRYSKYCNASKFKQRAIWTGHCKRIVEFGAEWWPHAYAECSQNSTSDCTQHCLSFARNTFKNSIILEKQKIDLSTKGKSMKPCRAFVVSQKIWKKGPEM